MSTVYPTLPRLAVRDSFDDEDLSDVDDEVFVRDGRNGGLKIDEEGGVKRPLMAPRRKCKITRTSTARKLTCQSLLVPCCYGIVAILVLLGLIILVIFAVSIFPTPLTVLKNWLAQGDTVEALNLDVAPCTSLSSSLVWTRTLPKLTSEAALRSADVNGDSVDDIIIGFSTGLDGTNTPQYVCSVYFNGQTPCLGGIIVLDGKTGDTIWIHWTSHVVFSLDCGIDLNHDKVKDCIAAGRGGILHAINGRNGSLIWELPTHNFGAPEERRKVLDVYDANYIYDVDGDDVGDIIAAHTVQMEGARSSAIVIVSGRTGHIVRRIPMAEKSHLYLAPQTLVHPDGERILLIVTGSHEQPGGLYAVPFVDILYGEVKLRELYHDSTKGILSSPILADLTRDGTEDIIVAMSNSAIIAYDGLTFDQLWNYTVSNSEVISSPIPGYYNDDDVPDFMVKHNVGPGFPVYYYSVATILDGRSGKPLLRKGMIDSVSGQMSGLSITVNDYGNDWFLHWSADCLNHEAEQSKYKFPRTTKLVSQMRADLCGLRFNSTLIMKFLAMNQHVAPPGLPLYVSRDWENLEYNDSVDPRREAERYAEMHSLARGDYDTELDVPSSITERSPRINRPGRRRGNPNSSRDMETNVYSDQTQYYPRENGAKTANNYGNNNNDFDSDEDWVDKWDDDNEQQVIKDYDTLYDEGDGRTIVSQLKTNNGIREQRSHSKINNDTNDAKNQLDPSMDYTNGQNENIQIPTKPIKESTSHQNLQRAKDFDTQFSRVVKKRETGSKESEENGQKEIAIDTLQSVKPVFEIVKRPLNQTSTTNDGVTDHLANEAQATTTSIANIATETAMNISQKTPENVTGFPSTSRTQSSSQRRTIVVETTTRSSHASTMDEQSFEKSTWVTRDIMSKVRRDDAADADIEKIFKRESMKNVNWKEKHSRLENPKSNSRSKREIDTERVSSEVRRSGVQRQPPTGILLPSLAKADYSSITNSIDLVFVTSWLPPSDASVVLLERDLDCIRRKKKESARDNKDPEDRDEMEKECLNERGVDYKILEEARDRENVKIPLGQMTIYRTQLQCVCPDDLLIGQSCRGISEQQSWSEHLGPFANGYFKPLRKPAS